MRKLLNPKTILTLLLVTLTQFTYAQESGVESLSPELRALLSKEMLAIQEGMMAIIPAYSEGNTADIASIAKHIKESFVLKQNLTSAQKEELHNKLPASFLKLDEQFHYNAGMLQHVAEMNKTELIGFYFAQLSEACAGCHSLHATHRFPALMQKPKEHEHSH